MLCHNNDKIKKNDNNNIISLHSACSKNVMPIFKICCSWVNFTLWSVLYHFKYNFK